jgi:carboxymethylenebutenolidase
MSSLPRAALVIGLVLGVVVPARPKNDAPNSTPAGSPVHVTRWNATGPGKRAAVVLLYGGAGPKLIEEAPDYRRYPEALAARGYHVFMPYYSDRATDEVQTVRETIGFVAAQPDVDPVRIGVLGFSRGAFIAVGGAGQDAGVHACVELYGGLRRAHAAKITRMPPTLILHGDKDADVPVEEAYALEAFLKSKGATYEMRIYRGQEHGIDGADGADSVARVATFFDEHL